MPQIVMDPSWIEGMGERIRTTGQRMPDPPGRPRSDAGAERVDVAFEDSIGSLADHVLGLGAGMVRLGQQAMDAARTMVEVDES